MTGIEKLNRVIEKSLLLLDIPIIQFLVICLLVIYNTVLIPSFNNVVCQWFRWFWFKLFYVLIIIYVALKDKTIAILLSISYVLSLHILDKNGQMDLKQRRKRVTFNNDVKYHTIPSEESNDEGIKTWNGQISAQGIDGDVVGINMK
tara:strand:- start:1341 stop:1781 length:441 start_codon:yes stop_codon:yes gene_type:complete